jgi:hypothetical protein
MPKKARDGNDTSGLLHYLYGPGKRDEHVDPHLVAAWDPDIKDPARSPDMTLTDLALILDAPVHALLGRKPSKHVYHVAVRNPPEDRTLTDAEWARVARELMHAAGIHPHGDDQGCRWVAVRHADDHIHIVATRARQDGRQPDISWDIVKMHDVARRFEVELGLRRLTHGDRTARKWSRTGETEKAARRGLQETARETLQRAVREAAAAATSDADFFARLGAAGLRVQQRIAPDGNVTGYSVALPGDRDGRQQPVWFSGSRLAADLSLPRVRERWQKVAAIRPIALAEAWKVAEVKVRQAAVQLGTGGLHQGAGDVAALGDLVVLAAVISPHLVRGKIRDAAWEFERASRAPAARSLEGQARTLYRESSQVLAQSVAATGRNDAAAALGFLLALVTAVEASRRWHEAQQYRAQAEAAGRAGRLLREAVEATAAQSHRRQSRKTSARRNRGAEATGTAASWPMSGVVREAVPEHAGDVLSNAAWPALRQRLMQIEQAGEDPTNVLRAVAEQRELTSAESVAEVLIWRLDGWQRQRSFAAATAGSSPSSTSSVGGGRSGPVRRAQAPSPRRRPPGDEQSRGPRRTR